jgi:hypothetical protein
MPKPMVRIHNSQTNEIIDREMTAAEYKQHQADLTNIATLQAEAEAKATARQAILDRLGLTAEEAAILLG